MAKVIARVSGVALRPGISKNNRLYTRQAIAHMVAHAQERIESGDGLAVTDRTGKVAPEPLSTRTHHSADDDTTRLLGRITHLSLDEDGAARFRADIADTPHGRTIASLLDTSDGQPPFLRNVSIRGGWTGKVRTIPGENGDVVTADAVELDGLDYTASPGVPGAQVDHFEWVGGQRGPGESADGRVLITESVLEAHVTAITEETPAAEVAPAAAPATETAPATDPGRTGGELTGQIREALRHVMPAERAHTLANGRCVTCAPVGEGGNAPGNGQLPYGTVQYADQGYQADKQKRYPIDTKAHVKAALAYLAQKANAAKYSAAQLKRVMGRIRAAAKKFGITVSAEGWTIEPAYQITEQVAEFFGDAEAGSRAGSWCINASNGPVSINLSSYCMDPVDLDVILRAAADAACKALAALDPDMDGDVDVEGAGPNSDTDQDHGRESAPAVHVTVSEALAAAPATEPEPEPDPAAAAEETSPEEDPAPEPAAVTEKEEETGMSESTTQTAAGTAPAVETQPAPAAAPGGVTLTDGQFTALLEALRTPAQAPAPVAEAVPAAPAAPAPAPVAAAAPAAVTEADATAEQQRIDQMVDARLRAILAENKQPAPVEETDEARMARLVEARVTERMQAMVANGDVTPTRAGLTATGPVDEHRSPNPAAQGEGLNSNGLPASWPDKPLHQYSSEELANFTGPVLDHHVMGGRAVTTLR